ncbi:hypothetical protein I5I01_gp90 [Mycobacterium phage MooMoo]|uniref:Uncharacterized protein n=1 Tax=Mycobacterium phage MooMoo TaxID=2108127 RepID=A0A2P1JRC8_9CAUD|nr:hypothetical protein I5I01_gp90 [Mycobacterium phage MooMoo]AVO21695.1 hypothetical protein SEA_MOOMOO_90 [Mycobacterium phage MooMoo]
MKITRCSTCNKVYEYPDPKHDRTLRHRIWYVITACFWAA